MVSNTGNKMNRNYTQNRSNNAGKDNKADKERKQTKESRHNESLQRRLIPFLTFVPTFMYVLVHLPIRKVCFDLVHCFH